MIPAIAPQTNLVDSDVVAFILPFCELLDVVDILELILKYKERF
jgi:hypothetical protein